MRIVKVIYLLRHLFVFVFVFLFFLFYEKSFGKLVFDPFFLEYSMCLLIGLKIF